VIGEGGIHTVPVGLAKGTVRIVVAYGVGMLRDNLLGLGLLAGAGGFGGLRFTGMHTTVGGTHESTITAWRTLPSDPLAGGLFTGLTLQLLELGTQRGNFSNEGLEVHLGVGSGFGGRRGDLGNKCTGIVNATINSNCSL